MKKKIKEYSRIAIFSALWAMMEVFLGNYLHTIRLPFKGVILTMVPAFLFSLSPFFIKDRFSILKIGIVVAIIRSFASWKFNIFVTLAIFMQALLANIVVLLARKSFITPLFIGILTQSWTFFQSYFFRVVFMGSDLGETLERVSQMKLFDSIYNNLFLFLGILYLIHILPGIFSGYVGYVTGLRLNKHEE